VSVQRRRPVKSTEYSTTENVRTSQVLKSTGNDDVLETSNIAFVVRITYEFERSGWESGKEGRKVVYKAPGAYDGDAQPTVKGEGKASPGDRKSQWLALASWCEEHRIEPTAFIRVVFEHLALDRKLAPEPAQLRSEK
jgi:hypothetical protein